MAFRPGWVSTKESHKTCVGQVGHEVFLDIAGLAGKSFGSKIAAAHSTFHRRGPVSGGPVSGEVDARPRALRVRADSVELRADGVRGADFFDDSGFFKLCRIHF